MFNKKLNGFTLAEVLITLVVIGVVAALTIPTAINKFKERATIEKIKSSYAALSSAYRLAQMENGPKYSDWNCDGFVTYSNNSKQSNCMTYYIKKHLSRVKDCPITDSTGNCLGIDDATIYSLNGVEIGQFYSGGGDTFILSNGVPVGICRAKFFYIKTDNSDKLVFNKNFFFFYADDSEKGLLPYTDASWSCWTSMDKERLKTGVQSGCLKSAIQWIMTKGNMDYLH